MSKSNVCRVVAKVLIHYEKGVPPTSEELAKKLESKKDSGQVNILHDIEPHWDCRRAYKQRLSKS